MTAFLNPSEFKFRNKGIKSTASLARQLSISELELNYLADNASSLYSIAKKITKSDGDIRITYNAKPRLKRVLKRLRVRVLEHVRLPSYVSAGRKGVSYIDNAKTHLNSHSLLSEDVQKFFPSVSIAQVKKVFQYLYMMSPEVAELLSKLTTKDGYLPQGSPVSGSIANVVFFDKEPSLVKSLNDKNLKYTRYYDDIHISSQSSDISRDVGRIRCTVYGMLKSVGVEPHKSSDKSNFAHVGQRMVVHGIIVNNEELSPNPKLVSDVRAILFQIRRELRGECSVDKIVSLVLSCRGKIQTLKSQGDKKTPRYSRLIMKFIGKIDERAAKKFVRGIRKVKSKAEFKRVQARIKVLKAVNPKVNAIILSECEKKWKTLKAL